MQEATVEITVLQTPANEERMKKRDRQEETPLTTSTNQPRDKSRGLILSLRRKCLKDQLGA